MCLHVLRSIDATDGAYRFFLKGLPPFSRTRNSTIRRIRLVGRGWPRGNCTEPFPVLCRASSYWNAPIPRDVG